MPGGRNTAPVQKNAQPRTVRSGAVPLRSARARHCTQVSHCCPFHVGKLIMLAPCIPMTRSCTLSTCKVERVDSSRYLCILTKVSRPACFTTLPHRSHSLPACPCPLQLTDAHNDVECEEGGLRREKKLHHVNRCQAQRAVSSRYRLALQRICSRRPCNLQPRLSGCRVDFNFISLRSTAALVAAAIQQPRHFGAEARLAAAAC